MSNEIWKDIDGYIGLYQVSNLGNIKSLDYRRTGKEQILKSGTNKDGYLVIKLYKNGKYKTYSVHRLVADAFIDNPNNLPCIDHVNTIRIDNRLDNLKWCTHRENMNNPLTIEKMRGELHPMYGRRGELASMYGKYGKLHPNSKPINQLSLNGDFIKMWDCAADIERELGFNNSIISRCCNGKYKSAYNYKWSFAG